MKTQLQFQSKANHFICLMALMLISIVGWGQVVQVQDNFGTGTHNPTRWN